MNDFWAFNVSSGNWTWLGGSPSISQKGIYTGANAWPGSRYSSAIWAVTSDSIYLFGGYGFDSISSNYNAEKNPMSF